MKQGLILLVVIGWLTPLVSAEEIATGHVFSILELPFEGPAQKASDTPERDIDFWVEFAHESGEPIHTVYGFFDGDSQGNIEGNRFKIRFCPTKEGIWSLRKVHSNRKELDGQLQGDSIKALPSSHPGFWMIDPDSPGQRWYQRSDGSHAYIVGNTHYSFLSGYGPENQPSSNDITTDILANAEYFKKMRMGLSGDHYPNPDEKPFLDDAGNLTDWGDYSHRPNPRWFHQRVDLAIQTAYENDLILDLILAGPDREESRSTLRAKHNQGDPAPFLKYIAARYGSYPNVWICLCNEYEIRTPVYPEERLAEMGVLIQQFLPYSTPLSVHSTPKTMWSEKFEKLTPWHDHQIIQKKIRNAHDSADTIQNTWKNPKGNQPLMKPTVNDELSYQGAGDKHSEGDTIESHLGAFLGGGYGSTGEKSGNKRGQYFRGKFDPNEHSAADNLLYLRQIIDRNISFWEMKPDLTLFENLHDNFRGMAWADHEYVLGTNASRHQMKAHLPAGTWKITRYDILAKSESVLTEAAQGVFEFDSPDHRAILFHFKKNPPSTTTKPLQ